MQQRYKKKEQTGKKKQQQQIVFVNPPRILVLFELEHKKIPFYLQNTLVEKIERTSRGEINFQTLWVVGKELVEKKFTTFEN